MKISFLKAFTVVEMILVVVIISLLLSMGVMKLSWMGADRFNAESCVNAFYAPLSEWIYYASSSRMLSWDITPDQYRIEIDGVSGYSLGYFIGDQEWKYSEHPLSGAVLCQKGERYQVTMSADFDMIQMFPSLHSYGYEQGFSILRNNSSQATGAILLKFCSPRSEVLCLDFGIVHFDARTAQVKKSFCKLYYPKDASYPEKEKKCKERSTGS